jgi:hypothetical protein
VKFGNRLFVIGVLCVGVTATAHAGNQLFEGSWSVKAFGNERTGGTSESAVYSAFGLPQGIQCNPNQPRCPYESTPTDGGGNWSPFGGNQQYALFCAPWYDWLGYGTSARRRRGWFPRGYTCNSPPPGEHCLNTPPFYRNLNFFTSAGQPNATSCTAISTGATPGGKGLVQAGHPVTGAWGAATTGTQKGGFSFDAAPRDHAAGLRTTGQVGEFSAISPYVYSYTYATLRNDEGVFGPGNGLGTFNRDFYSHKGAVVIANISVKQGSAKFGGTMQMLGALTSKACYYRNGGCSLGSNDWRYDAVGTYAHTSLGVVTAGYVVTYVARYYNTALMQTSTINVYGSRFPWTTGSVTVTATGRGPHNTVHYAHGFDNRNTATSSGKGTIQLVSPVLTRWLQPALNFETGGIGILKIKFMPEPQAWVMLIAGVSLLGVGYRMRGR